MARGNPLITEEKLKKAEGRFNPNLRDEGAGFFSTLFTAGSNIGSDALTELGYIAQAVARPIDTGEAVLRVLAGYAQKALPDDWEAYLPEDWATNKVYANAINDYYADKYGSLEQAADSFAEQPVSVALDAFAVKALLTTISKQAAKRSIATAKMAETAKGTVMEGELAARAAADLKVAEELKRTEKYKGKFVWDEALGAYVPESSVVKPKIDAAEVAPLIDDIEAAAPSVQPSVANLNTEGMMRATRNQEVSPALADAAKIASETGTPIRVTSDDIAYYQMLKEAEARGGDFEGMAGYLEPEQLRALEAATGDSVLDNRTPRFNDPDLPFETTPVAAKSAELRKVEAEINELDEALVTGAYDLSIVEEAAIDAQVERLMTRREQLLAMPEPPDVEVPVAASGIDLTGTRATDGSLMTAATRNQTVSSALAAEAANASKLANSVRVTADANKLTRDKQRMADDNIMAAATQADLFENGSAAAYEAMIASQLANRAAQTSAVATTVPKGMMAVSPETKLAKLSSVESRIKDKTPVKKQEFAPVSPPKIQTETVIKPANVLPAIQRVGSAANQFTGDRDINGSLIPIAPDKGIDLDNTNPDIGIRDDSPPDVKIPKVKVSEKPGWYQGSSVEGTDDGNYWSADFEDEHWNTPAGVQEAIGIWGRPIGNRIGQRFN